MEKRFDELFYELDHEGAMRDDLLELQALKEISLELLNACKEALKHHQGGHSEIGHLLRDIIKKADNDQTKTIN